MSFELAVNPKCAIGDARADAAEVEADGALGQKIRDLAAEPAGVAAAPDAVLAGDRPHNVIIGVGNVPVRGAAALRAIGEAYRGGGGGRRETNLALSAASVRCHVGACARGGGAASWAAASGCARHAARR